MTTAEKALRSNRQPKIDWSYAGAPDPVTGTGAAISEQILMWIAGASASAFMVFLSRGGWVAWTWLETALAAVVAFDLVGGAVAFNLNSAKRFYHSPAQESEGRAIAFMKGPIYVPLTQFHPILVYLIYKPNAWATGVAIFLAGALSVAVIRIAPLFLARPLAILLTLMASFSAVYAAPPVAGFEWLVPAFFLKLVLGFGVREEPYRPNAPRN